LADHEASLGNAQTALQYAYEALPVLRAFRHPYAVSQLNNVAAYLNALDRYEEARDYARETLRLSSDLDAGLVSLDAMQHLGAVATLRPCADPAAREGDRLRGARILGFVDARLQERGTHRWGTEQIEFDRAVTALRAELGDVRAVSLMSEGAALGPHEAMELARSI
jgi:tetratricopeptide (TPR) repeat protein